MSNSARASDTTRPTPSDDDVARFVKRTTTASDVPLLLEDPIVIDDIVRVLAP